MRRPGRADIVNAGSGESGYNEWKVKGERRYSQVHKYWDLTVVNVGS
ncbi:unnamed protein product [Staurois parvus]|uniref:Uncharacterized protein n=1 Tax=Staurois parvus TaxID=386267 RepID=A0ABN9BEL3_9NEOB|nr:unnamed protein product [Staurois parvus]